MIGYDKKIVDI